MVRGLLDALATFTSLPVPGHREFDRDRARGALAGLPAAGLVVGTVAAVPSLLDGRLAILGAALSVGVLAWLTGALHLDGLADTADGLGSRRDPEQTLAIMRRSDIGPMGVITVLLVLLVDVAALAALPASLRVPVVIVAALVGRVAVVGLSVRGVPAARLGGFGALFADTTWPIVAAGWAGVGVLLAGAAGVPAALLGHASWALPPMLVAAAVLALAVALAQGRRIVRRLGGVTGDAFGAVLEIGFCAFVVLAALASTL